MHLTIHSQAHLFTHQVKELWFIGSSLLSVSVQLYEHNFEHATREVIRYQEEAATFHLHQFKLFCGSVFSNIWICSGSSIGFPSASSSATVYIMTLISRNCLLLCKQILANSNPPLIRQSHSCFSSFRWCLVYILVLKQFSGLKKW